MVDHVTTLAGFRIPDVDETGAVPVELGRGGCMLHDGLMPHRTLANTTTSHRRALAVHCRDAAASMKATREQEPRRTPPWSAAAGSRRGWRGSRTASVYRNRVIFRTRALSPAAMSPMVYWIQVRPLG